MKKLIPATLVVLAMMTPIQLLAISAPLQEQEQDVKKIEDDKLGSTKNVHRCDKLFLAGQFAESDFEVFKQKSITRIITLRTDGEIKWDEKAKAEKLGFKFIEVPFRKPDSLDDRVFDKIRELLKKDTGETLLHCGSANRVGAVWLPYRVLDQGVELETALKEARAVGMRNADYEKKAIDYIKRQQKK